MTIALGRHLLVEYYECDNYALNSKELITEAFLKAVKESGATLVDYRFSEFSPQGVSGVCIIAESHFSIHTWPEYGYAAVDYFTCGNKVNIEIALNIIKAMLKSHKMILTADVQRGILNTSKVETLLKIDGVPTDWQHCFEQEDAWGISTSVDVYGCNPEHIRNADHIKKYVKDLCERIDMKRYKDTEVVHFGSGEAEGFSMIQLIETSLISGHFANDTNVAYLDIFSCKYYDPREMAEFSLEFFEGNRYTMNVSTRKK